MEKKWVQQTLKKWKIPRANPDVLGFPHGNQSFLKFHTVTLILFVSLSWLSWAQSLPWRTWVLLVIFLSIAVSRTFAGLFLSQCKYAIEILEKAGMSDCKHALTPVATTSKLSTDSSSPYDNPTLYSCFADALQYLTFTWLDISYVVQQVCLFYYAWS